MTMNLLCLSAALMGSALVSSESAAAGARDHSSTASRDRRAGRAEPPEQKLSPASARENSQANDSKENSTRVGTDAEIEIKGEGLPYAPYDGPSRETLVRKEAVLEAGQRSTNSLNGSV